MLKSAARKIFLSKRKEATPQQRLKWDDLILINFQRISLPHIATVFTYAAMDEEVNTDAVVDYLNFNNPQMQVAYPVCNFKDHTMSAVATTTDTPFIKYRYGIPEPDMDGAMIVDPLNIDLIIVPLLCFDKQGYRVGYGKGFYDKFLAHTSKDVIKVGLSYYGPLDEIEDLDKFDVPLNYCVTPERTYEF